MKGLPSLLRSVPVVGSRKLVFSGGTEKVSVVPPGMEAMVPTFLPPEPAGT